MSKIKININGFELTGFASQTILDIATENNIDIPTLCHDERVKEYGACGLCIVEIENMPRLARACSTIAANGMIIKTETHRIFEARRSALELLLSNHTGDCRPPCVLSCPGKTDCQGYTGLIAIGEFKEAIKLIKDKIPLPASIGRVCPHPCEEACRRQLVEEPINIAQLKSFAADIDLEQDNPYIPDIAPNTNKKIAIVGGGPAGLSAAYFLRQKGHSITIYDATEKMGGMLRYGIPEYRLPKEVLDKEVALIKAMDITMLNGIKVGRDISFDYIKQNFDATIVAIGAWTSTKLRCVGEELEGVLGGIDFLFDVATNKHTLIGKKVAIVGGGNTAMDACRTAVRLGASEVYNIYRRTRNEMPAEEIEIIEAEEEGVIFKFLTNPIEIVGENGKVSKVVLQKMKLGEPDQSGRRSPIAIEGETETILLDTIIIAVGQGVDAKGIDSIELSKRNTIIADETTFRTNIDGVFAIGDATNKGPTIAIDAIGEAKRAADVIDSYLLGNIEPFKAPYYVTDTFTEDDFADREKVARVKIGHQPAKVRTRNFAPVTKSYSVTDAQTEASRCLECGCLDYYECKLLDYANKYDVKPELLEGETTHNEIDNSNPFILRNPDKCILCGLCVRVCEEVTLQSTLGLIDRGFNTVVKPEYMLPLKETNCISCGQCVTVCPTGALLENSSAPKNIPTKEINKDSVCSFCSIGCKTKLAYKGDTLFRSLPASNDSLLCVKGRFGTGEAQKFNKLFEPMVKYDDKLTKASLKDALLMITKSVQGLANKYGNDCVAVSISDKLTNEEIFIAKKYANEILKTDMIYNLNININGFEKALGIKGSPNKLEELVSTNTILVFAEDLLNTHTVYAFEIKKAVEAGAKLILVSTKDSTLDDYATIKINPTKNLDTLKQMVDVINKSSVLDETIVKAMNMYIDSKKSMIICDTSNYTEDAQILIASLALLSGHIGSPRDGIIALLPNCNSQGLCDIGVNTNKDEFLKLLSDNKIKGLITFGEDIPYDLSSVEFLAAFDNVVTDTTKKANVIVPFNSALKTTGTYTNASHLLQVVNAINDDAKANWEVIKELSNVSCKVFEYRSLLEIQRDISKTVKKQELKVIDLINAMDAMDAMDLVSNDLMFVDTLNTNATYNYFVSYLKNNNL